MFNDHVYITTSDKLQDFNLIYSYRDYFNHPKYIKTYIASNITSNIPSRLSSGYTLRNVIIEKEYYDNLYILRFNNIYLSSNVILPKIDFLEKYDSHNLDRTIELIISNKKYNNNIDENIINTDEAVILIFPPKQFVSEYAGGDLIFKLSDENSFQQIKIFWLVIKSEFEDLSKLY